MNTHQGFASVPQAMVIAEDLVKLLVAELNNDDPEKDAGPEHGRGDENRRLPQPRVHLIIRRHGLHEQTRPMEYIGKLALPEGAREEVVTQG